MSGVGRRLRIADRCKYVPVGAGNVLSGYPSCLESVD